MRHPLDPKRLEYQMVRMPAGVTPDGEGWRRFHSYATYDEGIVWLWSRMVHHDD